MKGHGSKFPQTQERAIAALLSFGSIGDAATACGVSGATLHRWLQLPDFQAQYRSARREVVEVAVSALQAATGDAVQVLRRNLVCGNPSVEIRSALIIIEQAIKAVEMTDLQVRLERIEERLLHESANTSQSFGATR